MLVFCWESQILSRTDVTRFWLQMGEARRGRGEQTAVFCNCKLQTDLSHRLHRFIKLQLQI